MVIRILFWAHRLSKRTYLLVKPRAIAGDLQEAEKQTHSTDLRDNWFRSQIHRATYGTSRFRGEWTPRTPDCQTAQQSSQMRLYCSLWNLGFVAFFVGVFWDCLTN